MRRRAYVDAVAMDEMTILQAEVLKVLASPVRLEILHRLAQGPTDVGRLAGEIGTSQPHASQHLAILRAAGLVEAERRGREMHYRLADPDVLVACDVMRGVLGRRLARLATVADRIQPTHAAPATPVAGPA
jgi:DNA-binding transcriptional ArsR family regulator